MGSRVLAALRDWFSGVARGSASCCSGDPIAAERQAIQARLEREAGRADPPPPGPMPGRWSKSTIALAVAGMVALSGLAFAQRGFFSFGEGREPESLNRPYDGRFTFARLKYTTAPGGYWYQGLPSWAHGYPMSEDNLMRIMNEVSYLGARTDAYDLFSLDDDELMKYPIAYITEAGWWTLTDSEAEAFRKYLQKGGFVIFDDFKVPGDFGAGGGGWERFEENMKRVLPGAKFVEMTPAHPIFHSFFEINSLDIVPQAYDQGRPMFRALFEDNDPNKRIMIIAAYNTDMSEFWEWSDTGYAPVEVSNQAYKIGINLFMYGLTH